MTTIGRRTTLLAMAIRVEDIKFSLPEQELTICSLGQDDIATLRAVLTRDDPRYNSVWNPQWALRSLLFGNRSTNIAAKGTADTKMIYLGHTEKPVLNSMGQPTIIEPGNFETVAHFGLVGNRLAANYEHRQLTAEGCLPVIAGTDVALCDNELLNQIQKNLPRGPRPDLPEREYCGAPMIGETITPTQEEINSLLGLIKEPNPLHHDWKSVDRTKFGDEMRQLDIESTIVPGVYTSTRSHLEILRLLAEIGISGQVLNMEDSFKGLVWTGFSKIYPRAREFRDPRPGRWFEIQVFDRAIPDPKDPTKERLALQKDFALPAS